VEANEPGKSIERAVEGPQDLPKTSASDDRPSSQFLDDGQTVKTGRGNEQP